MVCKVGQHAAATNLQPVTQAHNRALGDCYGINSHSYALSNENNITEQKKLPSTWQSLLISSMASAQSIVILLSLHRSIAQTMTGNK